MQKIILDTNFLMIPAQFKVDIFSEIRRIMDQKYQLYTLDKSTDELKKIIKEQKGKNKRAAKLALQLIKAKKVKIIKTGQGKADDLIAKIEGYVIATQDINLKKKLKNKNIPVITLRQKKYLILN